MTKAKLIGSLKYKNLRYTKNHPLRIPRVSLLLDFLVAMGLIEEEEKVEGRPAIMEELLLFHDKEYIDTLIEADECQCVPKGARERFGIGSYENPVSPAMFRGSSLATGSSVQAVELFLEGNSAFNPAGGMHHAFRDRAHGFCFINDPVIAIEVLRQKGFNKILYIDLDAHHCDGVQTAYYDSDEVYVLSLHQSPEYAFPFERGFIEERGEGKGKGYNLNLPLPKGVNDSEFLFILEKTLSHLLDVFTPQVYVVQLGTDPLLEDPLSKFELSNVGFLEAFRIVRDALGKGVYLGGGGYNPIALARSWAMIWCEISGRDIPENITPQGREVLEAVDWEEFDDEIDRSYMYEKLIDEPRTGEIREEMRRIALKMKELVYS
ncbi:acetoin utilization protein AcuC [Hydrogenivirga sp. 128-5-R1-1]|uniref:acetoin utilization protein AcuC n=1 Tax=Hydrogenivirga sp. 128-5-R1-1 TaxID=392423 RepID=UPI00015EF71F|nr:acetoin utilization protein AcuC [Hydrogenivirga sp. 128-5-R1-1]EDP74931.1 acetoin utilization protein [Hydrogenivirga sp. 128-5-R1-1]